MTTQQLTDYLYKKSLNVGCSNTQTQYFSEPLGTLSPIYPVQIWAQQSLIPTTAPILAPNQIDPSGTVQYKVHLPLAPMPSGVAWQSNTLINAIPFDYDPNGSYNYILYDSTNTQIFFGQQNWQIDNGSGILLFYQTPVPGTPPYNITFYKYVGTLGLSAYSPTDAQGRTVFSDGANGSNPVNLASSALTNALIDRNTNGFVTIANQYPPAGLSNTSPYSVINNSANTTLINEQITTVGAVYGTFISFPSNASNGQAYGVSIKCLGTSTSPLGQTILISTEASFYYATSTGTLPIVLSKNGTANLTPASLIISYDGTTFYNAQVLGVAGYTIVWNCRYLSSSIALLN